MTIDLVAKESDKINCYQVEVIGQQIMLDMDNKLVTETKDEMENKVKTLIIWAKGMQVGNQTIHIDPTVLFLRLIVLIERAEDTMEYFSYELTAITTSLLT